MPGRGDDEEMEEVEFALTSPLLQREINICGKVSQEKNNKDNKVKTVSRQNGSDVGSEVSEDEEDYSHLTDSETSE